MPLRFDDQVDVVISVVALGNTSITYQIDVDRDGESIAKGKMVAVFTDMESGAKKDWPQDIPQVLSPSEA